MSYIIGGIFVAAVLAVYVLLGRGKEDNASKLLTGGCCGGNVRSSKKNK